MAKQAIEIEPGECGSKVMPHSEVCMHISVAGHEMEFVLQDNGGKWPSVQLYKDGHPYSSSITPGEAGIFSRTDGTWYYYKEG